MMWYLVLVVLLSGVLGLTPEQCDYIISAEQEFQCHYGSSTITFMGKNDYAKVYCEGDGFICEDLPRFNYGKGLPLKSFAMWSCPSKLLRCMYDVLNTTSIDHMTLTKMTSPLVQEDLQHLEDLKMLMITLADSKNTMPITAINSLPNLKDLRIGGGNFHLSPEMFSQSPPLEYLELHTNNIRSIPVDTFVGLQSLMELNIWGNRIDNVTVGAFNGLSNLRALTLNTNKLKYIEAGAFDSIPQLSSLQLTANELTFIPNKLLEGLGKLENVTILMNFVKLELDNTLFANIANLKKVDLKNSQIDTLPRQLFHNSTNIEKLELSNNNLVKLPSSLFSRLAKLKYIDLSFNKLNDLSQDIFVGLNKLEYLNLNRNHIEMLPENLFSSQSKLKVLYIESNFITSIAWTCFQGATNLEILSLVSNKLTLEPNDLMYQPFPNISPFQYTKELRKLNLRDNDIRMIFDDWRTTLVKLEYLDLSWNKFEEFYKDQMDFLSAAITVDLRHNNISHVPLRPFIDLSGSNSNRNKLVLLDDNPFICDCFMYGLKLRTNTSTPEGELKLVLDQARCSSPPNLKGDLINQVSINDLLCDIPDCSDNCTCNAKISTNEFLMECIDLPSKLPNMQSKNFSFYFTETPELNIKLQNQPNNIEYYDIHTLNLSNTNLENLDFDPNESLKTLDLSNNKLSKIPIDFIESNIILYLANNSFDCECWYAESISILKKYNNVKDFNEVTCSNGELISNIDVTALCNTVNAAITAISIFVILAFVFITSAILVYRYRNEIMLYLSTRCCKGLIETVQSDLDKEYDVFVAFAHKDFEFVDDILLPKLENDFNQKVCVHYRDWLVGEFIHTQIMKSVENSRRTIIVLSRSFLESEWANLEFNTAHNLALHDRQTRVILILLNENITKNENISKEIKAYINTNTYLVWGDPKFWTRLNNALPKFKHRFKFIEALKRKSNTAKSTENGLDVHLNSDGKLINCAAKDPVNMNVQDTV